MRNAQLTVRAAGVEADAGYARITDFARYPELSPVVRSVMVRQLGGDEEHSDWEVFFRNGILRWTEADRFDAGRRLITFRQLHGDFEEFTGSWSVRQDGDGCLIDFAAEFDFGIPSLAGILDPVAERVLKETIAAVLAGLFDSSEVVPRSTTSSQPPVRAAQTVVV
ncbi:type II toxin-antitoxin system RatA family toxin [Streptomyces sp. R21]|uniref:Type II toxin-antitoxin system RatA family toxin n=1 Tax=Streptomyces sp. R21 TaxID=3238627 RepID=A0AB39P5X0_9ACTN